MKIGIVTYHKSHNYGAFLQAYALSSRLNSLDGVEAEVVNFRMDSEKRSYRWKISKNLFRSFHELKKHKMFDSIQLPFLSSEVCSVITKGEEFEAIVKNRYDLIVAGSDEIWKINQRRIFPNPYWLPGDYGCIKASYAASGRCDYSALGVYVAAEVTRLISDFSYIGVRDNSTFENIIKCAPDMSVELNCDPTFLFDFKIDKVKARERLCQQYGIKRHQKIIFLMYGSNELVRYIKKTVGKKAVILSTYDWNFGVKNLSSIAPLEWASAIAGSDLVITKYFHACCFSIINNTPFVAIEERAKQNEDSKLYDLLKAFNCLDRFAFKMKEAVNEKKIEKAWFAVLNDEKVDFRRNLDLYMKRSDSFFEFVEGIVAHIQETSNR